MKQLFPVEIMHNSVQTHFKTFSRTSRIIYLTILSGVLVALAVSPLIMVDITTRSKGVIRSDNERNRLCSLISGKIVEANVTENQSVTKGDTLFVLSIEEISSKKVWLEKQAEQTARHIADLKILINKRGEKFLSPYFLASYFQYKSKLAEFETQESRTQIELQRSKKLIEKGAIALQEFERVKFDHELIKQQKNSFIKDAFQQWEQQLLQEKIKLQDYTKQQKEINSRLEKHIITAPVTGVIYNYRGVIRNNNVVAGEELACISPEGTIIAECYVSPMDIGLVRKNTSVRFQIDAFNYNQWGSIEGKIIDISNEVVQLDKQTFFRVKCKLNKDYLELKNGYKGKVMTGMTLSARFLVTRRSLLQLLYDKVDNWLNPNN
ncbi:HlyD family efflux transporter periplasmic adaptor subunit [Prolixibacteraceae bacterium JC049]|nr:HlyD family efflux transporter periplasmic adaptor subunit [Prolixibacteraceae bacterium JC049]